MEVYGFHSNYLDSSLQLRRQTNPWLPNIPHYVPILSSCHHSPLLSMNLSVKPLAYLFFLLLTSCSVLHTHTHVGYMYVKQQFLSPHPTSPFLFPLFLHLPHSLMQFNSNGFYWLGDSSECSSSVQLHKRALRAFTRQSATFSSQSTAHAFACTFTHSHT